MEFSPSFFKNKQPIRSQEILRSTKEIKSNDQADSVNFGIKQSGI